MKRRIKRISPLQAGKMLGALYACMGPVLLPFFALAAVPERLPHPRNNQLELQRLLFSPG